MALDFGVSCKQRSEFGSCDTVELSMGDPTAITATSAAGGRLKREEASSVKHDSTFSQWKILIGASDWKDHSLGKEGAERYRIHNLPNCTSCPGVYELGVGISRPRLGRDERKLDSSAVVPVYLGQADNIRNRLQQYGREGAHLGNRCSNGEAVGIYQSICSYRGPGLFNEIFSKGFQIVYRWAPMKNKKDAEITEALLLERFDYAWNKGSNGARRTDDILKKLDLCTRESLFSLLSKKLRLFNRKRVGIEIKTEQLILENRDDLCTDMYNNRRFSEVFKIGRSQPILVSSPYSSSNVCGVAIGNGSVCTEPTAEGRKRCPEHKGMKVNGFTSKLNIGRKDSSDGYQNHGLTNRVIDQPYSFELHINHNNHLAPTCGVILDDGSPCKRPPTHGNKRCMVHKGRRVSRSTPKFVGEEVEQNSLCSGRDVCGLKIEDGKICMRQPVSGRKRCNLHKGMKCL